MASCGPTPVAEARVERDGEALRFSGALTRSALPMLWARLRDGVPARVLDLNAVDALDSAGLALLVHVAGRSADAVQVLGQPPGLAELCAAYRLDGQLRFSGV